MPAAAAKALRSDLLPWVESVADLGDNVVEVGPGPGLTTDLLRERTARLTAIEIDASLASKLAARLAGSNVEVIHGNAADTGLPEGTFSSAACFGALHHVPSAGLQDEVFRELFRVLRPSGHLLASDALDEEGTRQRHIGDVFVPLDPERLPERLAERVSPTSPCTSAGMISASTPASPVKRCRGSCRRAS
jgi:SAM-dependent methyltransferase